MVLTATATERSAPVYVAYSRVRGDVIKLLRLVPPRLKQFQMSFNRPNLHYEVRYKAANEDPYPEIVRLIHQFNSNRTKRLAREKGNLTAHLTQTRRFARFVESCIRPGDCYAMLLLRA
jgi:superfamily II DNA helicase RecQ